MDIKFDEAGFVKYLQEVLECIRWDNSKNNNSPFNINPKVWRINDVVIKQNIITPYSNSEKDEEIVEPNDILSIKKEFDKMASIFNHLVLIIRTKDASFVKSDLEGWYNYWYNNHKEILSENRYNDNIKNVFSKESSLEIIGDRNDSILGFISQRVFVCEDDQSLNKTFYTQEQKDWKSIVSTLVYEKEIIIVDPYFFLSDVGGGAFGNRELLFLNEICNSDDAKDFVIIHQNCVCAEWLAEFSRRFKEGHKEDELIINPHKKCHLTFVGVTLKNKQSLHDRFIVSNRRLFFSGHSFPLYFDDKGGFSAHGSIGLSVGSIADGNNEHVMIKTLEYLQCEILENDCYVYGDGISRLLDLSKNNIWNPQKGILQQYQYGRKIQLEWTGGLLHWNNFTTFRNNNKYFQERFARIVNIKRNKGANQDEYHWCSFAFVLNDNNKDSE